MSLTGLIYGGIVLLWLCYLVPLALRRYDEASRARSVERFSSAMRVLGSPSRSGRPVDPQAQRRAARSAARRRRRVLYGLLVLTAATAGTCAAGLAPWWALAVPTLAVLGFLVLARRQVSRSRIRGWERTLLAGAAAESRVLPTVRPAVVPAGGRADTAGAGTASTPPDDEPTVTLAVPPPEQVVAAAVPTTDGGSLWDPLPVTLPTYVTKPRAPRTVRTIDLDGPGAWSSGRVEVDPAEQSAEESAEGADESAPESAGGRVSEPARAVGD